MSKAYFLNLSIDQLWDEAKVLERIFSVRVPSSTHLIRINENLAIFLSGADDLVFGYQELDPEWLAFLREHQVSVGKLVPIHANPYDVDEWVKEAMKHCNVAQGSGLNFTFCGLSALEERFHQELHFPHNFSLSKSDFVDLNDKRRAMELAQRAHVDFPDTHLVEAAEICAQAGHLVKATFGSGGGGNLELTPNDPTTRFLLTRIKETNSTWLVQKKYSRLFDLTYFGSTQDTRPALILEVQYDHHGLSFRHRPWSRQNEMAGLIDRTWEQALQFLKARGYSGPFGVDGFCTNDNQFFPLNDLNVRWTKTHLLHEAAKRFQLSAEQWECHRVRRAGGSGPSFGHWWTRMKSQFKLNAKGEDANGNFIFPINVSGLQKNVPDVRAITPVEVTYLCGSRHTGQRALWADRVYNFVLNESL